MSSNELSAPEAGELPSDGLSIVSDDEISTIGNNNNIYEPIDDDDDELEKLMDDGDLYSDTFSDATSSKKRKKQKKKSKKLKKSKKRKKRRKSENESIEEISEDDTILDEVDNVKKLDDGFTPPLDQISYTPKRRNEYTPISRGTPSINATPESPMSDEAGTSKRNDYRSPHTPPMPLKSSRADERGHLSGRHSSMSSSKFCFLFIPEIA